jgi:hypothetical protein
MCIEKFESRWQVVGGEEKKGVAIERMASSPFPIYHLRQRRVPDVPGRAFSTALFRFDAYSSIGVVTTTSTVRQ